jgi:hypothetical protein
LGFVLWLAIERLAEPQVSEPNNNYGREFWGRRLPALGTLDFVTEENRFRVAITGSLKLVEQGEHAEALKLPDDAIAEEA